MPAEMLPLVNVLVGSSQYRALTEISPRPRAFSFARGPGVGAVGLGMPHDAATKGTPMLIDRRSVNVWLTLTSTACWTLTT